MKFQPPVLIFHHFLKFVMLKTIFSSFLIIAPFSTDLSFAAKPYWYSYDPKSGRHIPRTKDELDSVLTMHEKWLKKFKTSKGEYIVSRDSSSPANLERAILDSVDLRNRLLINMVLNSANLMSANLTRANLTNAYLLFANLTNADLNETNLTNANLNEANLTLASLAGANLTLASLAGTNLKYAFLSFSDLKDAIFQPDSIPSSEHILYAQNLDHLHYVTSPSKLLLLKKSLQEEGFGEAARQINAAYHRELFRHDQNIFGFIKKLAFDYTCEYGSNSSHLLLLIFIIWVICGFIYWPFLHIRMRYSGLYLFYSIKRINARADHFQVLKLFYKFSLRLNNYQSIFKACGIAFLFSLMSAFNIGFREINFGSWIRLLSFSEFDIKAKGLPRTISGIQSLLSFYFFVLWFLTLFGNPFDY